MTTELSQLGKREQQYFTLTDPAELECVARIQQTLLDEYHLDDHLEQLKTDTFDTFTLTRFCKRNKFDDTVVLEKVRAMALIKKKHNYYGMTLEEHYEKFAKHDTGMVEIAGVTKINHLFIVFKMEKYKAGGATKNATENEIIQMLFYSLKMRQKLVDDFQTFRNVLILDCSNMSTMRCMSYIGQIKWALKLFVSNGPESVANILIYNSPWTFNTLYSAISIMLPASLKKQIVFISSSEKQKFGKFAMRNILPEVYGGTHPRYPALGKFSEWSGIVTDQTRENKKKSRQGSCSLINI